MSDFYDRAGRPITQDEWEERFEDTDYKHVARTRITDGIEVSTVWLGYNHQWDDRRSPLIFETLILGGPCNYDRWRYPTEGAALAGHDQAVARAVDAVKGVHHE